MHRLGYMLGACLLGFSLPYVQAEPVRLRCDHRDNPLGIDSPAPRLSWQDDSTERDWSQTAYQVFVATCPEKLREGVADVWDSGMQSSGESVGIVYRGPSLAARKRYYWSVKVWDSRGQVTQAATPVWWEMGLLGKGDWAPAQWISWNDPEKEPDHAGIRWIWTPPSGDAAAKSKQVVFTRAFTLRDNPREVSLFLAVKSSFTAKVNGRDIAPKNAWSEFDRQDITSLLVTGENVIEVSVAAKAMGVNGLAGLVKIVHRDGEIERHPTNKLWQTRNTSAPGDAWAEEMASLDDPKFGGPGTPGDLPGSAANFRRDFKISKSVERARLYVTALGSYRMFVNGSRVGTDVLTPEFTNYNKRIVYQTYDVTALLQSGANVMAATLGDGWFGSGLGWTGERFYFMPGPTRLVAKLRVDYTDGSHDEVVTDGNWKTTASAIRHSEIYAGEVWDARLEEIGWENPGFDDARWSPAVVHEAPKGTLSAPLTEPVRVVDTLKPKSMSRTRNGGYLYDMGQNMVGWVRLKVKGPAGTRVQLRFAELITADGELSPASLRNANATDVYVLSGRGDEIYAPFFTFHGFRYVEVQGYPGGEPPRDGLVGEVISSVGRITGKIATSSELVNRMYDLAVWGQLGNFISVPTDCPQRDERLGYTGDAQVFWRTGSYNADIAAFTHHFLRNIVDEQLPSGAFTNTAPGVPQRNLREGSPGWVDAGVIIPWTAWTQYGDTGVIEAHWDAMERFMAYVLAINPDYIRRKGGSQLGDWLNMRAPTPADLIATGFWAIDAEMMAQMAAATGREAAAARYRELGVKLRETFQKEFIKDDGTIGNGSQASYVFAFAARMVPESLMAAAIANLVKAIEVRDWHLSTGFLASPYLLSVLVENGRTDVAYRLLLNETSPSWGYMIRQGATTWWERWNSDSSGDAMNSYNHYAFGSVVAWLYQNVAGIDVAPDGPGFRRIVIRPRPDERLTHARGEYDSVCGRIVTDWKMESSRRFVLDVVIPANTRATVFLPDLPNSRVTQNGQDRDVQKQPGWNVLTVGAGTYHFEVQ